MPSSKERKPNLARLTDPELLHTWGRLMELLRDRGIVQSGNSPIADVAETVVVEHYGGERAPPNTRGWDVRVGRRRLQVKALRQARRKRSQLSPIRSEDYDAVVVVVFDAELHVKEIWEIPRRAVPEVSRRSDWVNGRLPSLNRIRGHRLAKQIPVKRRWR